jgi:hypothetical protein
VVVTIAGTVVVVEVTVRVPAIVVVGAVAAGVPRTAIVDVVGAIVATEFCPVAIVVTGASITIDKTGATVVVVGATEVIALDELDDPDVPPPFVAVTLNVYDVTYVKPVTVHEPEEPVTVHVKEPGVDVTLNEAGVPPEPAATVTTADASPTSAVGAGGVPGTTG